MTRFHVPRVFLGPDGGGGNPLGVFLDGHAIGPDRRLDVAHELGFSETAFIDQVTDGSARIAISPPARSSVLPVTRRSGRRGCSRKSGRRSTRFTFVPVTSARGRTAS